MNVINLQSFAFSVVPLLEEVLMVSISKASSNFLSLPISLLFELLPVDGLNVCFIFCRFIRLILGSFVECDCVQGDVSLW